MLSFRLKKQTSKNVADTTFKERDLEIGAGQGDQKVLRGRGEVEKMGLMYF